MQITWTTTRAALPGASWPNILDDWSGFLREILQWRRDSIRKQTHEARTKNYIIDVLKAIKFSGVGVYTVSEILHRAGAPDVKVFHHP